MVSRMGAFGKKSGLEEVMKADLIHCKNFCKCHNVPPPIKTMKMPLKEQALQNNLPPTKGNQNTGHVSKQGGGQLPVM
jgi:hypothetical protein